MTVSATFGGGPGGPGKPSYRRMRPSARGSWGECPSCKTFCRAEDMRERTSDGLLVCAECNFREPTRRVIIASDTQTPRRSSPITVPPPPNNPDLPAGTVAPRDMRVKPNYRTPL